MQNLTHSFFENESTLYRASVKPSTGALFDDRSSLVDWGGALRWYCPQDGDAGFEKAINQVVNRVDGHLGIFRNGDRSLEVMAPVSSPIMKLQKKLKAMFDPDRILNPGRMYGEL